MSEVCGCQGEGRVFLVGIFLVKYDNIVCLAFYLALKSYAQVGTPTHPRKHPTTILLVL
jgi:hypothetical protein